MLRGSCLCGEVAFELSGEVMPIECCHCPRCRKACGGAFLPALASRTPGFRWVAGNDLVEVYEAPLRERPPAYRRAFCRSCGSPVPLVDATAPYFEVPAGCLDDDPGSVLLRHIFFGVKAPWYGPSDDLPRFERHVPEGERLPSLLGSE